MVQRAAREDQSIDMRDTDTDVAAGEQRAEHLIPGRAVQVDRTVDADVRGGDDPRLTINREADVADEARIKDRVDRRAIIVSAIGQPADSDAIGGRGMTV